MTPQEKLAALGKTTEGPWSLHHRPSGNWTVFRAADSDSAREQFYNGDWIHEGEHEANARLIALAPALRRFAERVLELHKPAITYRVDENTYWDAPPEDKPSTPVEYCPHCTGEQFFVFSPCPTVQAAQEELGG